MSNIPVRRSARPYEQAAVVLAGLGIAASLLIAWYAGAFLSVVAGGVLAGSLWIRHQPMTRWTRIAVVLVIAGIVLELAIGLIFTPVTAVRSG